MVSEADLVSHRDQFRTGSSCGGPQTTESSRLGVSAVLSCPASVSRADLVSRADPPLAIDGVAIRYPAGSATTNRLLA